MAEITTAEQKDIDAALGAFMASAEAEALRKDGAKMGNADEVLKAFKDWVKDDKNKAAAGVATTRAVIADGKKGPELDAQKDAMKTKFVQDATMRSVQPAFQAFLKTDEGKKLVESDQAIDGKSVMDAFQTWVNTTAMNPFDRTAMNPFDRNFVTAMLAAPGINIIQADRGTPAGADMANKADGLAIDALGKARDAFKASKMPLTQQEATKVNTAFTAFLASPEAQSLRDGATPPTDDQVMDKFKAWMAAPANKDNQMVKDAAAVVQLKEGQMSKPDFGTAFREDARVKKVDAAYAEFMKTAEGQAMITSPNTPDNAAMMKALNTWVNKAAAEVPPNAVARASQAAVNESAMNPALTNIDGARLVGKLKQQRTAGKSLQEEEEEKGLIEKNMKGLIGGLLGGLLGFLVGGPIGAILGLLLGGAIGGSQDEKGLLSGIFNPEPASPTMAKPQQFKGMPKGKSIVMVTADGQATQDVSKADRMLFGRFEGTGDARTFVVEGVAMRQTDDFQRSDAGTFKRDAAGLYVFEPATGQIPVTSRGNMDLSNPDTQKALQGVTDMAQNALIGKREALLDSVRQQRNSEMISKVQSAASEDKDAGTKTMAAMQSAFASRLEGMKVSEPDRSAIARAMTEKFADENFRKLDANKQMEEVLKMEITSGGKKRSIEAALRDPANGGLGDGVPGSKTGLELFKTTFAQVTTPLTTMVDGVMKDKLEGKRGIDMSKVPALVPLLPGSLGTPTTTVPVDLKPKGAEVSVLNGTGTNMFSSPIARAQAAVLVNYLDQEVDAGLKGRKGDIKLVEVQLENGGSVLMAGTMDASGTKFTATAVLAGNTIRELKDIGVKPEDATFNVSGGKIDMKAVSDNAKKVQQMLDKQPVKDAVQQAVTIIATGTVPNLPTMPDRQATGALR